MRSIRRIIARILDPRSSYGKLPGFDESVHEAEGLGGEKTSPFHIRDLIRNIPLTIGLIIVTFLFLLVLFGPVFAPFNPYISGQHILPHMDYERDIYVNPPLEPSADFPEFILGTNQWGTDILSMLMHGARTTLIMSGFITMVRVLLGLILGATAGWNEGKFVDRALMGLLGLITSLPLLISSMILIFVLDIREGLVVFIIALSVLGWSEIAQYVRSEFAILRKAAYIEGAQAVGLRGFQIAVRHVIPNVLPQLLVITFLEMGAVLMLLGELGFLGVYIGGGVTIDSGAFTGRNSTDTIIEIPEWGAMIADGFRLFYSAPHVVIPPATAFFVSILGFNTLGEGLRRLIEKHSLNTAFLLKKRMLVVIAGLSMATIFVINNTGAGPLYAKAAGGFEAIKAYAHIEALSEMQGRGVAQPGGEQAASYIAEWFEAYGLHGAWKHKSYIHQLDTMIVRPIEQPLLVILDENGGILQSFNHQLEFGYVIEGHGGNGNIEAPLTFVGFQPGREEYSFEEFKGLDLRGRIVLLIQGNAPSGFETEAMIRGALGVLWIAGEERDDIRSQIQFSDPTKEYMRLVTLPIFRIRPNVAEAILEQAGMNTTELIDLISDNADSGLMWVTQDLDVQVGMSLQLGDPQEYQVPSVMGYLPGTDVSLASEMVFLFVSYDGLGTDPDGTIYPGVNHNAAGVGVLLEIARLWQELELSPRRSVMFVAWGGGSLDESGARALIEDTRSFRHLPRIPAQFIILQLDYIGAGGDSLLFHPDSTKKLINLFTEANEVKGGIILTERLDAPEFTQEILTTEVRSWISIRWEDAILFPMEDTLDKIDREKLQQFGELLTLALTKLVRETKY